MVKKIFSKYQMLIGCTFTSVRLCFFKFLYWKYYAIHENRDRLCIFS